MGKRKVRFPRKSGKAIAFVCYNGKYTATPELREQYANEGKGGLALEYRSRRGTEYARKLMTSQSFHDAAVAWFKRHFQFGEVKPSTIGIVPRMQKTSRSGYTSDKFVVMADFMGNV